MLVNGYKEFPSHVRFAGATVPGPDMDIRFDGLGLIFDISTTRTKHTPDIHTYICIYNLRISG